MSVVTQGRDAMNAAPASESRLCMDKLDRGSSTIQVSNSEGYLCHISCQAILASPPRTVFAILTNPDNTAVFRDIKALGYRKVLQDADGLKVIEVEQRGEIRVLFKTHYFSTFLTVTEDCRDPDLLTTSFTLIQSDVLAKFQGTWHLTPLHPDCSDCSKTLVRLEQDVLPIGMPAYLSSVPILGNLLKGVCKRAVQRLLEDVEAIVTEMNRGTALEDVLQGSKSGSNNSMLDNSLESHALTDLSESDAEEETQQS